MSLNLKQFRDYIVAPTLREIGLYSKSAERLVIGTALTESRLEYVKQINGPALGIYQCEPATHKDIVDNFLMYRLPLMKKLAPFNVDFADHSQLTYNLKYATAICRIHYLRDPNPLPEQNDILGMAETWKRCYNTHRGKGTVEDFLNKASQILEI